MKKLKNRVNWGISDEQVRIIDENGDMLGVFPKDEAVKKALGLGLDLVEISSQSPPVCKIVNYGKYTYAIDKKVSQDKKKQKVVLLKEIKLRTNIGVHDYETKVRHAMDFLKESCKVKFSLRFFGREISHPEVGMERMKKIIKDLEFVGKVELPPKMEGNFIYMIIVPI